MKRNISTCGRMRRAQKVFDYSIERKDCMRDNIKIYITSFGSDSN